MTGRPGTDHVVDVLDYHLRHRGGPALGVGPDPYEPSAQPHPMALALYAHGLADLHVATGRASYADAAIETIDRLIALGQRDRGGLSWGLGFAWGNTAASEPFAITTAVAARALAAADERLGHRPARLALSQAATWLLETLPWRIGTDPAPRYSPNRAYVLANVASMVASALYRTAALTGRSRFADAADMATRFVLHRQDPATGLWRYGAVGERMHGHLRRADVVDALHMGYTLEGPLDAIDLRASRLDVGPECRSGALAGRELLAPGDRLREKVVLARRSDPAAQALLRNPRLASKLIDADAFLLVFAEESRAAGYGALIGALSRSAALGLGGTDLLERLVRRVLQVHAADASGRFRYRANDRAAYPRQEAHVFAGLATYVAARSGFPHQLSETVKHHG